MKVFVLLALVACAAALPVDDTPEVAAAKATFKAAFDAAAARAEAAPDYDLDGKISTYTGFLSGVDGRLSPFYTNSLPYGAYGLHAPVVAASPVAGALTYSGLGLANTYSLPTVYNLPGVYGFPGAYSFPGYPFIQVTKSKE
nr:uncharacterized protein LOC128696291 [Cherax quadricarinatus]